MKLTHSVDAEPMYSFEVKRLGETIRVPAGTFVLPLGHEKDGFGQTIQFFDASKDGTSWESYKTYDRLRTRDN